VFQEFLINSLDTIGIIGSIIAPLLVMSAGSGDIKIPPYLAIFS